MVLALNVLAVEHVSNVLLM